MSGPDFALHHHGSISLLTPLTRHGLAWVDAHIPGDAMRWGASGVVVEPRYVSGIVVGIAGDGLTVG